MPGQHDEERRLSARLQTAIGAGSMAGLAKLCDEAAERLGADHEVVLAGEHALETRRDAVRTPIESGPVWARLGERAAVSLPPDSPVAKAIRARCRRQLLCCGRRGDLDAVIELCRRESDPDARLDLALALRDRARFDGSTEDLPDALTMAEAEVRRRGDDHVAVAVAHRVEAEVRLALGAFDPEAAAHGLRLAEAMAGDADDEMPGWRVLLAEALLLNGRSAEAGRVARLAYALEAEVFDPARPLLVVARTEAVAQGRVTARLAAGQREAFFPADSHYVVEARRLAEELFRC
jgi:hypothetical protein